MGQQDPIYKTKDGQTVTKQQLINSGYSEDRIKKGLTGGILSLVGDTQSPDQSFITKDGQLVTHSQLLQSGYSQDRIDKGIANGVLNPKKSEVVNEPEKIDWVTRTFGKQLSVQPKDEGITGLTPTGKTQGGIPLVSMEEDHTDKDKLANYLYSLKTEKEKDLAKSQSVIASTKPFKKNERPYDQTIEEAKAESAKIVDEILSVPEGIVDPIKTIHNRIDETQDTKKAISYLGAKGIIEQNLMPSGFATKQLLQNTPFGNAAPDNLTANAMKERVAQYEKVAEPFRAVGNNANFQDDLYDAAIRSYANTNPHFKKQLEAAGVDLSKSNLRVMLGDGSSKVGQIVSTVFNDPDVLDFIRSEKPELIPGFIEQSQNVLYNNKDFGKVQLANELSKLIQKSGYNKIDPIFNFASGVKKMGDIIAQGEFYSDPKKLKFYQENKDDILNMLDAPSFFEGFASGGKSVGKGIINTFTEPFKSTSESIKNSWEKEASNVSADPDGLVKFLHDTGHALGFVSAIGATGNIAALNYAPTTAQVISGTLPFFGDMLEQGREKYPDNPIKAVTSATFNTALYGALSTSIFPAAKIKQALGDVAPEVTNIVENLASGSITKEVARQEMNTLFKKSVDFLGGAISKNTKIAAELTGITALNRGLDRVMGLDDKTFDEFHPDNELSETFKSMFLSNSLVSGVARYGEMRKGNKIVEQSLYEAATNPKQTERDIEALSVKDPSVNKQELLDNLAFVTKTKQELDANNIVPQKQGKFLLQAMNEKILLKQKEDIMSRTASIENAALREAEKSKIVGVDAQIEESRSVQDELLKPEAEVPLSEKDKLLSQLRENSTGLAKGEDMQYFIDKAAEDPAAFMEAHDKKTTKLLLNEVAVEKLVENRDYLVKNFGESESTDFLTQIIKQKEKDKTKAAVIMPGEKNNTFDVPLKKTEIDQNRELPTENTPDEKPAEPSSPSMPENQSFESKKADIEKRRSDELNKVELGESNLDRDKRDNRKEKYEAAEKMIEKQKSVNDSDFSDWLETKEARDIFNIFGENDFGAINSRRQESIDRVLRMNTPREVTINKKYDAELAELEKSQPSMPVRENYSNKSDADIEKRMAELEDVHGGIPSLTKSEVDNKEYNSLEKEMEKRERDSVFSKPLDKVGEAVDELIKKEKDKPNGFGAFIEKRDARETKEVADRYLDVKKLTDRELMVDFKDALFGNPTTWYADGLKLRESMKEAANRGIDIETLLKGVEKEFTKDGFDESTAREVIAGMLKPVFEGSQKVNEKGLPVREEGKEAIAKIEKHNQEVDKRIQEVKDGHEAAVSSLKSEQGGKEVTLDEVLVPGKKFTAPNGTKYEIVDAGNGRVQVLSNGESIAIVGRKSNGEILGDVDGLDFLRYAAGKTDAKKVDNTSKIKELEQKRDAEISNLENQKKEIPKVDETTSSIKGDGGKTFEERTDKEHADYIKTKFADEFSKKGVPKEQVDAAVALMEARAKASGLGEGWYRQIEDIGNGEFTSNDVLYQFVPKPLKRAARLTAMFGLLWNLNAKVVNKNIQYKNDKNTKSIINELSSTNGTLFLDKDGNVMPSDVGINKNTEKYIDSIWAKAGYPKIKITADKGRQRYDPLTNTISLHLKGFDDSVTPNTNEKGEVDGYMISPGLIFNEMSHALQAAEGDLTLGRIAVDFLKSGLSANKTYETKGTIENDAHSVIAKDLMKEYVKTLQTKDAIVQPTPQEVKTITKFVEDYYTVNKETAPKEVIDRAISLWEKFGSPKILPDSTAKDERAYANADWEYPDGKRKAKNITLGNITNFDDYISEMAHAIQYTSNAELNIGQYKNEADRDKFEYERKGSVEYDAHKLIEPLIANYVLFGKKGDDLILSTMNASAPSIKDQIITAAEKYNVKFQNNKGAAETLANGRKVIHALDAPDFSTTVHELAHVFEDEISSTDRKVVQDWAKTPEWNTKTSEAFARGFESYLRDGNAPTPELKNLFQKFKEWLTNIYQSLKGSPIEKKVSPEVKEVFDRLLTEQKNEGSIKGEKTDASEIVPPEKPPVEEPVAEPEPEKEWTSIRKEKQNEIEEVKQAYKDQETQTWSRTLNQGLERVQLDNPGSSLYDASKQSMEKFFAASQKNKKLGADEKDLAVMQNLKRETSKRIADLSDALNSPDDITREVALMKADQLNDDLIKTSLVIKDITTTGGRVLNYAQSELGFDPQYGLQIRRMQMQKSNDGKPLSEAQLEKTAELWQQEKELIQKEQELREKGMQEEFDRKIEEVRKQYQKASGPVKAPEAARKKTLSQSGKEAADRLRKGKLGKDEVLGTFPGAKQAINLVIETIAQIVEKGATVAEAIAEFIKDHVEKGKEKEFKEAFLDHNYRANKATDALDAIKESADADGHTDITQDMVAKNQIRDFVDSYLGEMEPKDILKQATEDLKQVLPDVTPEKMREAYLKNGEYYIEPKEKLEKDIARDRRELRNLTKLEQDISDLESIKKLRQKIFSTPKEKTDAEKQLIEKKNELLTSIRTEKNDLSKQISELEKERKKNEKATEAEKREIERNINKKKQKLAELDEDIKSVTDQGELIKRGTVKSDKVLDADIEAKKELLKKALVDKGEKLGREDKYTKASFVTRAGVHNDRLKEISTKIQERLDKGDLSPEEIASLKSLKDKVNGSTILLNEKSALSQGTVLDYGLTRLKELQKEFDKSDKSDASKDFKRLIQRAIDKFDRDKNESEQDMKLQRVKDRLKSDNLERERKRNAGEFEDKPPVILKKSDADLVKLKIERDKVESLFNYEKRKLENKNRSGARRVVDFLKSFYVTTLIMKATTMAKVAATSLIRPNVEAATKATFGNLFRAISPAVAARAKAGGESASLKSVQKMYQAYFMQKGEKGLERMYEESNKKYEEAKSAYESNTDPSKEQQLKGKMDSALIEASGNLLYQYIGGSSLKDALGAFVQRSNKIEREFGYLDAETIKDGNVADKIKYVMEFIGRSHSAVKTFSGRANFAAGFIARLEAAQKDGADISNPDTILQVANESYLDWDRGKYQQSNFISDSFNAISRKLEQEYKGTQYEKYAKALTSLQKFDVAITRVPVNLLHEAVMEYTFGGLKALYKLGQVEYKASKEAKQEGFDPGTPEFKEAVKDYISKIDKDEAAMIVRSFRKGGFAMGLFALFAIGGVVNYGGFHHRGEKKEGEEAPGELLPGEMEIMGVKMPKILGKILDHTPAMFPTLLGLNTARVYNEKLMSGETDLASALASIKAQLQTIQDQVPQSQSSFYNPIAVGTDAVSAVKRQLGFKKKKAETPKEKAVESIKKQTTRAINVARKNGASLQYIRKIKDEGEDAVNRLE